VLPETKLKYIQIGQMCLLSLQLVCSAQVWVELHEETFKPTEATVSMSVTSVGAAAF